MSKSRRLRLSHIRSAFRLIGEVAESGAAWRVHYLSELIRLTGSQVAMGGDSFVRNGHIQIPGAIDLGWATESDRRIYLDFMSQGLYHKEPTIPPTLANPDASWTRTRRMLIADRDYFRSDGFVARREGHIGDWLHSCQPWPEDRVICMLQLDRALRDAKFTAVERKLVHLCQIELALDRVARRRRRREQLAVDLPPRVREVLDKLLIGDSEKQIVARMGISRHTVHQYVKQIYSHFEVHSRAELLARWYHT